MHLRLLTLAVAATLTSLSLNATAAQGTAPAGSAGEVAPNTGSTAVAGAAVLPAPLTWNGITLYGVVDVGAAYQTHGTPLSDYFAQGLEYGISANSRQRVVALAPNGLSQTRLGLKGDYEFRDGWHALFTAESRINPLSGEIANGPKSLVQNNGVPAAAQNSNGDSSQAGQLLSAAAWVGIRSRDFGTLTLGRQNGLLYDNILRYDPLGGSYAFSLIGYSATAAGGGNSEYNRLNDSVRYIYAPGPWHVGAQYQAAGQEVGGQAYQFNLGADAGPWSADLTYAAKVNGLALSTFSPTAAQLTALQASGYPLTSVVKATASDTRALGLFGKFDGGGWSAYAGIENIVYSTPDLGSADVSVGASTVGGYTIGNLAANPYGNAKTLQVTWAGARYALTQELELSGGFYHYRQNSYAGGSNAGCGSAVSSACSGSENAGSLVIDYRFDPRLDVYSGIFLTHVDGGLASGFLYTSNLSITSGVRFRF